MALILESNTSILFRCRTNRETRMPFPRNLRLAKKLTMVGSGGGGRNVALCVGMVCRGVAKKNASILSMESLKRSTKNSVGGRLNPRNSFVFVANILVQYGKIGLVKYNEVLKTDINTRKKPPCFDLRTFVKRVRMNIGTLSRRRNVFLGLYI